MDTQEPKVTFDKGANSSKLKIKFPDPYEELKGKYDFQTKIIISVFVIAFLTMVFMVAGILLDAWHFNSAVYKEYSNKTKTLESFQENNKLLLEENKKNQELILEQQKQIQNLLKK